MNFFHLEQISQIIRLYNRNPECTDLIKGESVSPQCKQQEDEMSPKSLFSIFVSFGMIFLTACNLISGTDKNDTGNANMPNPAAVFCEENGGTVEIRTAEDGSQTGFCIFPDGSECDEWAFYRGECKPGDSFNMSANMPNPASVFCEENGGSVEIRTAEDGSQTGICVFPDGSECDEWAFFRGECTPGESSAMNTNMPNPASVFCEENGGKSEIRTAEDGSQSGVCVFPDGSECDEWAFYRGECQTGDSTSQNPVVAVALADDGCSIYQNPDLGYSFHFPENSTITENDEPTRSFTIQGPMFEDNYWPMIMIAHPQDREEFRPPEEFDLVQWLSDHNLIDAENYGLMEIAGTTAVHIRFNSNSGQSYDFDHYYFAHQDQLYSIVILHTSGKEDWDMYNHFLNSFQFTD